MALHSLGKISFTLGARAAVHSEGPGWQTDDKLSGFVGYD